MRFEAGLLLFPLFVLWLSPIFWCSSSMVTLDDFQHSNKQTENTLHATQKRLMSTCLYNISVIFFFFVLGYWLFLSPKKIGLLYSRWATFSITARVRHSNLWIFGMGAYLFYLMWTSTLLIIHLLGCLSDSICILDKPA